MSNDKLSIKSNLPIAISVAAAYSVGLWGLYIQPQLLAPLVEKFNVTEAEIGQLYGVENFLYFIAILFTTIPVTKFSRTKMAIGGSVLVVLGSVASAYAGSIGMLMICRATVSIGGGIVSSAGTAAAAGSPDPNRTYALAGMIYLLGFSLGRSVIPMGLENFGVKGIYLSLALFSALTIPTYFLLYPPIKSEAANTNFFKLILDAPYRLLGIMAMSGLFIYELGQNAAFTYQDKLGEKAGVDAGERGLAYLLLSTMALLGCGLAAWIGSRFGRFWPLVCGLGLNIISSSMFMLLENPDYYIYLLCLWNISYSFSMPYLMGTLASLDREGRWAVAGDAFWNLASTPGPVIATLIVLHMGYNPLAIWVLTSGAVGMVLFCYTSKQTDKLELLA